MNETVINVSTTILTCRGTIPAQLVLAIATPDSLLNHPTLIHTKLN